MDSIIVKQSTIHGNGIFATSPISSGTIIENSIIIPLSFRSRYHFDPQLYRYLHINWNCDCQECKNHGFVMYLMTGHSMLYNYSDNPNTELAFDYKNNLLEIKTIKDISINDEITIKDLKKEYKEKFESQDK